MESAGYVLIALYTQHKYITDSMCGVQEENALYHNIKGSPLLSPVQLINYLPKIVGCFISASIFHAQNFSSSHFHRLL